MITSTANTRLKDIRKLRDRKFRMESGLAWVEGLRACGEAFLRPENIHQLVYCPEKLHSEFADGLIKKAEQYHVELIPVSREVFPSLSGKENPQGIGLVIRQQFQLIESVHPGAGDLWIILDRIADPGNLGTIMRTLDACGGRGIILVDQCTDPYDSTAIRASTGAIFHLDLIKVEMQDLINWKMKTTTQLVCAVAVPEALDYHSIQYKTPLLLMMGSEREGLQPALMEICDTRVFIPMIGHVDSLNLAEATAIMLYEIFNQRREGKKIVGGNK
jgi:RNA methyltransferase, TrmH family